MLQQIEAVVNQSGSSRSEPKVCPLASSGIHFVRQSSLEEQATNYIKLCKQVGFENQEIISMSNMVIQILENDTAGILNRTTSAVDKIRKFFIDKYQDINTESLESREITESEFLNISRLFNKRDVEAFALNCGKTFNEIENMLEDKSADIAAENFLFKAKDAGKISTVKALLEKLEHNKELLETLDHHKKLLEKSKHNTPGMANPSVSAYDRVFERFKKHYGDSVNFHNIEISDSDLYFLGKQLSRYECLQFGLISGLNYHSISHTSYESILFRVKMKGEITSLADILAKLSEIGSLVCDCS